MHHLGCILCSIIYSHCSTLLLPQDLTNTALPTHLCDLHINQPTRINLIFFHAILYILKRWASSKVHSKLKLPPQSHSPYFIPLLLYLSSHISPLHSYLMSHLSTLLSTLLSLHLSTLLSLHLSSLLSLHLSPLSSHFTSPLSSHFTSLLIRAALFLKVLKNLAQ